MKDFHFLPVPCCHFSRGFGGPTEWQYHQSNLLGDGQHQVAATVEEGRGLGEVCPISPSLLSQSPSFPSTFPLFLSSLPSLSSFSPSPPLSLPTSLPPHLSPSPPLSLPFPFLPLPPRVDYWKFHDQTREKLSRIKRAQHIDHRLYAGLFSSQHNDRRSSLVNGQLFCFLRYICIQIYYLLSRKKNNKNKIEGLIGERTFDFGSIHYRSIVTNSCKIFHSNSIGRVWTKQNTWIIPIDESNSLNLETEIKWQIIIKDIPSTTNHVTNKPLHVDFQCKIALLKSPIV